MEGVCTSVSARLYTSSSTQVVGPVYCAGSHVLTSAVRSLHRKKWSLNQDSAAWRLEFFPFITHNEGTRDDQRTFVEAVREDKIAVRIPHFHVFLVLAELVDSLLGELHN